jgi:hypothetical protein
MAAAGLHRQCVRTSVRNLAASARLVGVGLAVYLRQVLFLQACDACKPQRQLGETPTTEQRIRADRAVGSQDRIADQKGRFRQPLIWQGYCS